MLREVDSAGVKPSLWTSVCTRMIDLSFAKSHSSPDEPRRVSLLAVLRCREKAKVQRKFIKSLFCKVTLP